MNNNENRIGTSDYEQVHAELSDEFVDLFGEQTAGELAYDLAAEHEPVVRAGGAS